MKKLAFVSPMLLPVDKKTGGGVEQLMYSFILQNEQTPRFKIDLFTLPLTEEEKKIFKFTSFIEINLSRSEVVIQKLKNFFNMLFHKKKCDLMANKISKIVKNNNYDSILVENRMGFCKSILNNDTKNVFYHMHNDFDDYDKTIDNYDYIEDRITKIFAVSNSIKETLLSKRKSSKVLVVPNCIDFNKFLLSKDEKKIVEEMKNEFHFNENDYVIGFSGRITEEKGIEELVLSFKRLCKAVDNAKLLVIGSAWFSNKNLSLFEKKLYTIIDEEIKDKIVFTGYVEHDRIKLYYDMIDVLVIPSKCKEAFGLVALEGIAMGKNIITTGEGGLKEITGEVAEMVCKDKLYEDLYESLFNATTIDNYFAKYSKPIKDFFVIHNEYSLISYFEKISQSLLMEADAE